ncbi:MAG: hypothetical protein COB09_18595 [Thalassobium sp.]|nr:MAG: hypothetical protein COB09_18595 [Thalassobium sp.]
MSEINLVKATAVMIRFPRVEKNTVPDIKVHAGTDQDYRDVYVKNPKLIEYLELGVKNGDSQCKIDLAYIKKRAEG